MISYDLMYRSPLHPAETNLEIAIGGIMFRDETIENLRMQIKALRSILSLHGFEDQNVEALQYAHLREYNENQETT